MKVAAHLFLAVPVFASFAGCSQFASQGVNVDGVRMQQRGNYNAAADRFRQAIAVDPNAPDGYYNLAATMHHLGRIHGNQNELLQAENYYNQCLERDANHVEAHRGLAVLLTDTGRTDAAFRLLNGWKEASPNSAAPRVELARLLQETGNSDAATGQLVEALAFDPYNSRALSALGRIRDESGDHVQALQNYERSLAINRQQQHVKDRVATLRASLGMGHFVGPSPQISGDTRVVRQPAASVRY